jgi:hypothetical protein
VSTESVRPSRWWIAPVLGLVVVVTAVGALVAHNLYQRPTGLPVGVGLAPSTSTSNTAEPGSTTVRVSTEVSNFALGGQVRSVLQRYFDAINQKKYAAWRAVVTTNRAQEELEPAFNSGYASTADGTIFVYRVDSTPSNGLLVMLSFHSEQDASLAPKDFPHACIEWHVVWPLSWDGKTMKVDAGESGRTPQRQVC